VRHGDELLGATANGLDCQRGLGTPNGDVAQRVHVTVKVSPLDVLAQEDKVVGHDVSLGSAQCLAVVCRVERQVSRDGLLRTAHAAHRRWAVHVNKCIVVAR
ncbi:uncharacterized protein TM35_001761000, partial [Trypanosoma theileri]